MTKNGTPEFPLAHLHGLGCIAFPSQKGEVLRPGEGDGVVEGASLNLVGGQKRTEAPTQKQSACRSVFMYGASRLVATSFVPAASPPLRLHLFFCWPSTNFTRRAHLEVRRLDRSRCPGCTVTELGCTESSSPTLAYIMFATLTFPTPPRCEARQKNRRSSA